MSKILIFECRNGQEKISQTYMASIPSLRDQRDLGDLLPSLPGEMFKTGHHHSACSQLRVLASIVELGIEGWEGREGKKNGVPGAKNGIAAWLQPHRESNSLSHHVSQ